MLPALGSKVLLSVPTEYSIKSLPNMDEIGCLNTCFFNTPELKSCFYNSKSKSCSVANGTAFLLLDNKIATDDPENGLRKRLLSVERPALS